MLGVASVLHSFFFLYASFDVLEFRWKRVCGETSKSFRRNGFREKASKTQEGKTRRSEAWFEMFPFVTFVCSGSFQFFESVAAVEFQERTRVFDWLNKRHKHAPRFSSLFHVSSISRCQQFQGCAKSVERGGPPDMIVSLFFFSEPAEVLPPRQVIRGGRAGVGGWRRGAEGVTQGGSCRGGSEIDWSRTWAEPSWR